MWERNYNISSAIDRTLIHKNLLNTSLNTCFFASFDFGRLVRGDGNSPTAHITVFWYKADALAT